jgi:hypothetical protein
MTHHDWSDETFDWKSLYAAEDLIRKVCKFGNIGLHIKEKYGTLRCTPYFFDGSLHSLLYPAYVYSQFPQWLWRFDIYYITPFLQWLRLPKLTFWLQIPFYTLAFYIAMKKYPHIKDEICSDIDGYEFVIGGKEIHKKYWRTIYDRDDEETEETTD